MPSFQRFGRVIAIPGRHPMQRRVGFRSPKGFGPEVTRIYSQDSLVALPSTNADLSIPFSGVDYGNVAIDDSTRVPVIGANYLLQQFKQKGTSTSLGITAAWNGQASIAPTTSPVFLQIYNQSSGLWETLASNSSAAADTDFDLLGTQFTNLANYYDSNLFASLRVYQAPTGGWAGSTTNLTHRWPMLDANVSGTTITDVIGSINGTATAGITSTTGPFSNTARLFNGTSDIISLASSPLPAMASPHSAFMWLNFTSGSIEKGTMLGDFQSTGNGVRFVYDPVGNLFGTGAIAVHIDLGGVEFARVTGNVAVPATNAWHHVGYTWDGTSTIKLYVDGAVQTDSNFVGSMGAIASGHSIGARGDSTDWFKGGLYNVVVYSAVLSGAEVSALYAAQ